jgi:pyrophosphatase PpaX
MTVCQKQDIAGIMPFEILHMQVIRPKCRFDAVIFDLDGTLADTFPTVLRIFNRVMREQTGREWTLEELLPYFGPPETIILRNLFPEEEIHQPLIESFFRQSAADGAEIRPFPGIDRLVRRLGETGIPLAVYSGASTHSARLRVGHAGLLDHFAVVLGGDQVENYKPHPEGLLKLLDQFQVAPESAVFIGDMVADITAGRGAGTKTIAVTWGAATAAELRAARPDFVIDAPAELENLLFD